MNDQVLIALISAIAGIIGGTGGPSIIKALTGRKPRRAIAVDSDVKLAQEAANQARASAVYAQQMQESARQAWAQASAAEARAQQVSREAGDRQDELERRADSVQYSLDIVARYVVWLLALIGDPETTMESLRDNVSRHRPPAGVGREVT